jgi:predicted metal-binding membrane protein
MTAPRVTFAEAAFARERRLVTAALALVVVLCWIWIVPMARDMYGSMSGPASWMTTTSWDLTHLLLLFGMWAAMMTGMMLPSVAPTLLVYAMVVRKSEGASADARVSSFAAGYLSVWTAFSVAAVLLQRLLTRALMLSSMMELTNRRVSAAALAVAGAYQLTPLKRACLASCRSPAAYIAEHWRPGSRGAFAMGFRHGLFCLGCCWALMLLLFAGGIMNLWTIAGLTIFVLVEKLAPYGVQDGRLSGILLLAVALWLALS